ncbi:WD40 repeat domain-containing protein [Actinoplanes sp. NPDC051346]|uniref:WD40 repeat domain-containing protein n=1 Tax=Actinoplanes sp. NPDC051346 TaxID=3155048 RepID=UPI00341B4F50
MMGDARTAMDVDHSVARPGMEWRVRIEVAHRSPVRCVVGATTGDGRGLIVTAGGDEMFRLWDASSGTAADAIACSSSSVLPSLVSFLGVLDVAGSRLLVSADGTAIRRIDLATGREVGPRLRPRQAAWLPKGGLGPVAILADDDSAMLVAGGPSGSVHRWDAMTGELLGQDWRAHDGKVLALAVLRGSGRSMIVSSGTDGFVRRWDAPTGEPIGEAWVGVNEPISVLACVSVDGRDVVIGQEYLGPIHRWDAVTGEPIGAPLPLEGWGLEMGGLAVTPDGRMLLAVDRGGTPWRWDLTTRDPVAEPLSEPTTLVTAAAVVPSEQGWLFVTGGQRGELRRWDTAGRRIGADLPGHSARVQQVLALPAGPDSGGRTVLLSTGQDGLRAWDAATGATAGPQGAGPLPSAGGLAAVWQHDGRLLAASATDDGFLRCDVTAGVVKEPPADEPEPPLTNVAPGVFPDGRRFFAGAGLDGGIYLVDAATGEALGEPLRGLKSQMLAGVAVVTLPDSTVMVAAGGEDCRVVRWNAVTGERIGKPLPAGEYIPVRLIFHPLSDGRVILSAHDGAGVYRWDAVTGEQLGPPLRTGGEPGAGLRLDTVSPDRILAVGQDDLVRCWDVVTGEHLGDVPDTICATTAILPDGRTLFVTGGVDGSITFTPIPARH